MPDKVSVAPMFVTSIVVYPTVTVDVVNVSRPWSLNYKLQKISYLQIVKNL